MWVFTHSGLPEEKILNLSFDQFRSLYDSCERLDATEKRINAWTMMVATQANHKAMKKWSKLWDTIIEGTDDDAAKLVEDFGKGI